MTSAEPGPDREENLDGVEIVTLEARAVDEMVGKIRAAAGLAGADAAVDAWRAAHGDEHWRERGHDHAPDGMLVPHATYPDGTEKIYTDLEHAQNLF